VTKMGMTESGEIETEPSEGRGTPGGQFNLAVAGKKKHRGSKKERRGYSRGATSNCLRNFHLDGEKRGQLVPLKRGGTGEGRGDRGGQQNLRNKRPG